jgi:hypothetical protein
MSSKIVSFATPNNMATINKGNFLDIDIPEHDIT